MGRIAIDKTIAAPVEKVFDTIADVENFSQAVPDIVRVEFLSEAKAGVGTRFRETRRMRGKEATVELEVTEYEKNRRIRIVSDTHGTVWDSVFTVTDQGDATGLSLVMEATPHRLLPRLMNPLMGGLMRKALDHDMEAVKAYCEGQNG